MVSIFPSEPRFITRVITTGPLEDCSLMVNTKRVPSMSPQETLAVESSPEVEDFASVPYRLHLDCCLKSISA